MARLKRIDIQYGIVIQYGTDNVRNDKTDLD